MTVMVQVDVKKNFVFSHDFKWHFLRKSLLLSLLLLCLRATTAVFYDYNYDIAVFLNIFRGFK